MYISKITLHKLKWIKVLSGIETLTIDAKNQVQVLIGTNGGGKSAVLRELTPLPAQKNDYERGGYKEITIIHKGHEYVLKNDFLEKSGKHSFLLDGEELNVSGLASLQTSLCETHLGYTQLVDDLVHCRFKMTVLPPSARKTLIYSISPSTPDFVIELHKKAKSALRACHSNLQLLYKRKKEIEEKLIKDDELSSLTKKKDDLQKKQLELASKISVLEARISTCQSDLTTLDHGKDVTLEEGLAYKKRLEDTRLAITDRHLTREKVESLDSEIAITEEKLSSLKHTLEDVLQEYQKYQIDIDAIQDAGIQECKTLIQSKNQILQEVAHWRQYRRIDDDRYEAHVKARDTIYSIVERMRPETLQDVEGWTHLLDYTYKRELQDRKSTLLHKTTQEEIQLKMGADYCTKCQTKIDRLPVGPSVETDSCSSCSFKAYFDRSKQELTEELDRLTKSKSISEEKYRALKMELERVLHTEEALLYKASYLEQVSQALEGTVWMMDQKSLLRILEGDTASWLNSLTMTLQAQDRLREIEELEKSIKEATMTLSTLEKTNTPAVMILRQVVTDKKKKINELESRIHSLTSKLKLLQDSKRLVTCYHDLLAEGQTTLASLNAWSKYQEVKFYLAYLDKDIRHVLYQEKEAIDTELFSIQQVLDAQMKLKARYQEEICDIIKTLERKQDAYYYLELALSPETGLPYEQTRAFIGAIITNANRVLSKLWTSPIELVMPTSNETLFAFKAKVNHNDSAPIERLSKSQKAVIDFAFYISILYAAGYIDYPVFFDECEDGFDITHKQTYLEWLKMYVDTMYIPELWLISHDASTYSGFLFKDVTCLNKENIYVPEGVNLHTTIKTA